MSVIIWVNNYNASGLSSSFNSKYFYKKQWKMDNDNYIINKKCYTICLLMECYTNLKQNKMSIAINIDNK